MVSNRWLAILGLTACFWSALQAQRADSRYRIKEIYFFGGAGLDTEKVRRSLPIHPGDEIPKDKMSDIFNAANEVVRRETGKSATDIAPVTVNATDWNLYIGLSGQSSHPLKFRPTPRGKMVLPVELIDSYKKTLDLLPEALKHGAGEDDSSGYALSSYPALREAQLRLHSLAQKNEDVVLRTLGGSGDAFHREAAATALGYCDASKRQIAALVAATHDESGEVRNNATRALSVLGMSKSTLATEISADPFIAMINSGTWTDRNKGSFMLISLTASRKPALLRSLREKAFDSLAEMADWDAEHCLIAQLILGRIGGLPDAKTVELSRAGKASEIVAVARNAHV